MNEQETIAAAMSLLGRRTSEAKRAAWAANRLKSPALQPGRKVSAEAKANMKAAQVRRRERERQQAEREGLAG